MCPSSACLGRRLNHLKLQLSPPQCKSLKVWRSNHVHSPNDARREKELPSDWLCTLQFRALLAVLCFWTVGLTYSSLFIIPNEWKTKPRKSDTSSFSASQKPFPENEIPLKAQNEKGKWLKCRNLSCTMGFEIERISFAGQIKNKIYIWHH